MPARFSQVLRQYYQRHLKRRGHLVLALLAIAVLVVDVLNPTAWNPLRRGIDAAFRPLDSVIAQGNQQVLEAQAFVSRLFHQAEELKFLREENQNLRLWRQYAQALELENRQLNSHFQAIPVLPEHHIQHFRISKRLSATQTLELASEDLAHLPDFAAVISSDALIGRVLAVQDAAGKIMLLSHPESRIPVQVGSDGIQAMLAGQGGRLARLEYPQRSFRRIRSGDPVVSAHFSDYFPTGLKVGTVETVQQDNITVKLAFDPDLLRYIGVVSAKRGGS